VCGGGVGEERGCVPDHLRIHRSQRGSPKKASRRSLRRGSGGGGRSPSASALKESHWKGPLPNVEAAFHPLQGRKKGFSLLGGALQEGNDRSKKSNRKGRYLIRSARKGRCPSEGSPTGGKRGLESVIHGGETLLLPSKNLNRHPSTPREDPLRSTNNYQVVTMDFEFSASKDSPGRGSPAKGKRKLLSRGPFRYSGLEVGTAQAGEAGKTAAWASPASPGL